ncbi:DUF438 domain-containing protein [Sphaerochaeta sp. PS]|uniref:DUF438 domain-containing protein n=1 Tax=Sphaerochaeta sp. PS TaxID=3076336 RepID=UPI0028A45E0F|nr:DUF438 domain-containing protein [Sphaerochaeta sp. PS]MDT4762077.1 DUF438 domain-containing protein [Sphaerochaeta sp. PS]
MDIDKQDVLKNIIGKLHAGASPESVKQEFLREFGSVSAEDLAAAEKKLMEEGMKLEQVQKLCDVHAFVFEDNLQAVHSSKKVDSIPGHPAFVFKGENAGLTAFLDKEFEPALHAYAADGTESNKEDLMQAVKSLSKLHLHYQRKENLFFPYLEKAGITAPPKVMWGVDDEIRSLWKGVLAYLPSKGKAVLPDVEKLLAQVRSMITKENNILTPMLLENMDAEDWLTVARDSADIGYCFNGGIEGASPSDALTWYRWNASLSGKEDVLEQEGDRVILPSGTLSLEELTSMLNTMPADITFVGKDDKVRYFSEGKERVFPRTRSIIGRDVAHCHPPKSLHVVEKLVEEFKQGKKDEESFWLQRGSAFVLIRYYAVRSEKGEYLGVMEVTEEISSLRSLEGNKLLSD